jgi:5S rRNA maturation endonuclease (ribonuclease M5)
MISKDDILRVVSTRDIIEHYIGRIDMRKKYTNATRVDNKPSGKFYTDSKGNTVFTDFAQKEYSYDCFTLVMRLYNLSFGEALIKINSDMNLGLSKEVIIANRVNTPNTKLLVNEIVKSYDFDIEFREFSLFDIKYWNQHGIYDLSDIRAVSKSYLISNETIYDNIDNTVDTKSKKILIYSDTLHDPCYYYSCKAIDSNLKLGKLKHKLYRPFSKEDKWRSNFNERTVWGIDMLDYSIDILIITKSVKDCKLLKQYVNNVIAVSSESIVLSNDIMYYLIKYFNNIYILFDYDKAGIETANRYVELFGIKSIFTDDKLQKDASDYYKMYGLTKFKKWLQSKIGKSYVEL